MADDPGKSTADGPRPDTAETMHAPGDGASSGGMGPAPQGIPVPVPWYRRPLFWGIVLSLLILALLGWLLWKQWQAAQAEKQAQEAALAARLAKNAEMDAYLAQLRALLKEEPCVIKEKLAQLPPPPDAVPGAVPGGRSGEPLQIPSDVAPQGTPVTPQQAPARPGSMAQLLEQSTVLVLARQPQGLSMGSGFFISRRHVLSNAHVVSNAGQAFIINKATGGVLQATVRHRSTTGGRDFALLELPADAAITPLEFAPGVERTQRVSAWGFPGAVTNDDPKFMALLQGNASAVPEVVYTEGVVSVILDRTPPLVVHTATVSQGNSGGPLVNEQGQVVGINTFIKLDDASYRQSSIAIVGSSITAYLREIGIGFSQAAATPAAAQAQDGKADGQKGVRP
ncbi:trypsin-like peptidase domain-containing protein [uncultured Desulfovibrio sp.]|uniref:S1 family peptidase n=1 Tax=uncultured Desulfovibrio sp. TaxID=167968 RepID=UPI0025D334B6|nr:trypsin-like peptidase domain-containing protein [uncultured Desulfovibrio sp.]